MKQYMIQIEIIFIGEKEVVVDNIPSVRLIYLLASVVNRGTAASLHEVV